MEPEFKCYSLCVVSHAPIQWISVNFNCPRPVLLKSALTFMAPLYCVAQWVQFAPSWAWVDYRAKVSVSDDTTEEMTPPPPTSLCASCLSSRGVVSWIMRPHMHDEMFRGPVLAWICTDFMRAAASSPEDVLLLPAFPCSGSHSLPASPMVFNEYWKVCDKALLFRSSTPPIT